MTGKVKLENDELVLVCGKNKTLLSPNNSLRFLNAIQNYVFDYGHARVEFRIETLGTGTDEFDVIDQDFALIEKVYDLSFGTTKESVSIATERHNKNQYPIGGFIPGSQTKTCSCCQNYFVGDQNSNQCEICALEDQMKQ